MNLSHLKSNLFQIRKAFFEYHQGFDYLKQRYLYAPKILKHSSPLEKPVNIDDLSIHILSCHRDIVMLCWSLASFYSVAEFSADLHIHSDGSLTRSDRDAIKRLFPSADIINPENFEALYRDNFDPYPLIKKFRFKIPKYFLMKKLIDPFFVSHKKNILIIDSDLAWFRHPEKIESEIKANCPNSLMMAYCGGVKPNYVYFKNGKRLDPKLACMNSGIVLYNRQNFDLKLLEEYLSNIDIKNKSNIHFIEQAGYAYCLEHLKMLPADEYIIKGIPEDKTVLKHYTGPRRLQFYTQALGLIKSCVSL